MEIRRQKEVVEAFHYDMTEPRSRNRFESGLLAFERNDRKLSERT